MTSEKKEAHRILCLELDYDAERSEPPPGAVPIVGADPASSPCLLQLALKMEYMKLYQGKYEVWNHTYKDNKGKKNECIILGEVIKA